MLRGVSRRIIEVNDTGSEYFEKALFFVKGEAEKNSDSLKKEAQKIMLSYFEGGVGSKRQGCLRYTDTRRKKRRTAVLLIGAFTLLAAAVTLAVIMF